jgi:hypothetical protein
MILKVAVSWGELFDKIAILEIKRDRLTDPAQRADVEAELAALVQVRDAALPPDADITVETGELRAVNESLWQIEDDIRDCERRQDFGPDFIALARAVYRTNDRRAAIKRRISTALGSALVEEKSYTHYD